MLKLGIKGNALIAFACIYGFSQDGKSEFRGSAQYIADWCGISRTAAFNVLKSLVDKNLVVKNDFFSNGVKLCNYKYNPEGIQETCQGIKKLDRGVQETYTGGSQETCHHTISSYNKDNIVNRTRVKKDFIPPTLEQVESYVLEKKLVINPYKFIDWYSKTDWKDNKGKQIKNWKMKAINWDSREKEKNPSALPYSKPLSLKDKVPREKKKCPKCGGDIRGSACVVCYTNYDYNGDEI